MTREKHTMKTSSFGLIAEFDGNPSEIPYMAVNDVLPVLPLRNMVVFPGVYLPINIGRKSSGELIEYMEHAGNDALMFMAAQKDADVENPTVSDLYKMGVLAKVLKVLHLPDGSTSAIVQSFSRGVICEAVDDGAPFLTARVESVADEETSPGIANDNLTAALEAAFHDVVARYIHLDEKVSPEMKYATENLNGSRIFFNFMATNVPLSIVLKMEALEANTYVERLRKMTKSLAREVARLELLQQVKQETSFELNEQQREFFLQQEIRNIKRELGTDEGGDVARFQQRLQEAVGMPENIQTHIQTEISKMERQNPSSPDYNVLYNYIDTVLSLPWQASPCDQISISRARKILDADHFGMEKVKERILEHLAVMAFSKSERAPILCLYGPPGVGKTSLGRSIAKALGREYTRISLGGLHDETEIRGHRRTYIGAMCGRIIKNMIKCKTVNPVFILDEIDKVGGQSFNGNPQSALLELLDPEQNAAFHDNYIDFDYDMSRIFFIATANNIADIPVALRDRMEFIEVEGYLTEEKIEIARRHLVPETLKEMQIPVLVRIQPAALEFTVERYTRESGVRNLKQKIGKIIRRAILEKGSDGHLPKSITVKLPDVEHYLGSPRFTRDSCQGNAFAGVVTGLAWTAVGGDILFVETSLSRSRHPHLTTTGNLGDVMKESAVLALEYVKAHANVLAIDYRIFEQWSVHVHVPEGATPKDGPSAGITLATSIASALTQRRVRDHLAMTGEITLRGKVLPVGGIKEKILAAKRAGITDIILSGDNKRDVADIPAEYTEGLTFHYVETILDVWSIALLEEKVDNPLEITLVNDSDPLSHPA